MEDRVIQDADRLVLIGTVYMHPMEALRLYETEVITKDELQQALGVSR